MGTAQPGRPRITLHLAMALCAAAFLMGRFIRPAPSDAPANAPAPVTELRQARQLIQPLRAQQQAVVQAPGGAAANGTAGGLLAPGALERAALEGTGLLRLRPPLLPAASGSDHYVVQPFQILSWHPRIVVYPNFIDAERAQHVVQLAKDRLQASDLQYRPTENADPSQQVRTSKGAFITAPQDPQGVLGWLEEKIAAVTLHPVSHGEAFNVLQYQKGAHYDSHFDFFDPKDFGPQSSTRVATVLLYLTDVDEGGETVFKKEGLDGDKVVVTDYKSCNPEDYKYKPRLGDAVLFFSVTPDHQLDRRSLHGGCPVRGASEKWVATKWIRDKPAQ